MDVDTFRKGIFSLRTRRLGTIGEMLIRKLVTLDKSSSIFHDLFDNTNNKRIEVKFSVVRHKHTFVVTEDTALDAIAIAARNDANVVLFSEWTNSKFDCNIEQVKKLEFDVLYYGLCFSDVVVLFRVTTDKITPEMHFSEKQHKGNVGEGQFHVNQATFQHHLDNYHYKTITYGEFLCLLA